jgi:hypothetical protein
MYKKGRVKGKYLKSKNCHLNVKMYSRVWYRLAHIESEPFVENLV